MMRRVLIVEDTPADAKQSTAVMKKLGAEEGLVLNNIAAALMFLQDVVEGAKQTPDLLLLDLSFPQESGFEVLRFWKSNPKLQPMQIVASVRNAVVFPRLDARSLMRTHLMYLATTPQPA